MYWLEFGGEDDPFAALEATAAASDVRMLAPGIGTATALAPDRMAGLALTTAAGEVVGHTDASVESARALLETAGIEREGTVAVRARDVRSSADVDTQRAERELGGVLTDRGFSVDLDDPDHTLRALFARGELARDGAAAEGSPLGVEASGLVEVAADADDADVCLLGWVDVERAAAFGDRAPTDRPFFQPGSMDPALARALGNLAGARPGATIVDPMCGTGGLLLEGTLLGARMVGVDAQQKMVRGSRENLGELAPRDADWEVARGDARRLPLAADAADGLVVDVPYERQSAVAADDLDDLVEGALAAAHDVAPRAVVVADREWVDAATSVGWTVECVHRRRVHRSLVRSVHLLERSE
ncbi:RNA methylase [Salinarchaeum sp. Harcht-Bsk1]|uniref:THUMP domain-containing protein n=1 Tax=Salinarchaeum sp. Harcht-Bsk1 TaxID=1333523 RepID=UPI0003423E3E|nr:methyltransferase domain-containing protein [Salinarchaeum sp. Harcht-Bsk1]AGN00503.1 RNA methylase [Salinarchaeum sp. Harcht-Bsk1]